MSTLELTSEEKDKLRAAWLWELGTANANRAAEKQDAAIGIPEVDREADCGRANVVIEEGGKQPFTKRLKVNNIGREHGSGNWCVHSWDLHEVRTQSVSVHWTAAMEFARHLNQAGIPTTVISYWS